MEFTKMLYGGDYNPEQWPQEVWQEDVKLMKEAGVNLVSLGIFSWAKLEPKDGQFNFFWLDQLLDLLYKNGISVNLATPTASPPPWMVQTHPDILPVTAEGYKLWHGSRRHYCPHSPEYNFYAKRIATELAGRYKDHPALGMWHIDNEYGCHVSECFCEHSVLAFREWLQKRYGTLEKFNHAWGTAFWSQYYGAWEEVQPPRSTPANPNPTQQLDWARFMSDSWLDCFEEQKAVIKAITPDIPVTTNFMGFHKGVDYFKFAAHEDLVSNDAYPDTYLPDWMAQSAMVCDLIRSLGKNAPWLLMEQATSQVNWRQINTGKRPGVMRLGSLQAVARGADGIMFFQWRQSKAGAEKHHSAMLPHGGTKTRTWQEVKKLGGELSVLRGLVGSQVQAEVGILMDWENWWALELDSKPSCELQMVPGLYEFYRVFYKMKLPVDFVHPLSDLSKYKLLVLPHLYMVSTEAAKNINTYVKKGGTLLLNFFSGITDENEQIHPGGYPAPFSEMLGLWIEEYAAFPENLSNKVLTNEGKHFVCDFWADIIRLQGAEALATFEKDYYAGLSALTRHAYGSGKAYYLGTRLEEAGQDWLVAELCREAGVKTQLAGLPEEVEAVFRHKDGKSWLFLLNHAVEERKINLAIKGTDLITGTFIDGKIHLSGSDAAVIELEG